MARWGDSADFLKTLVSKAEIVTTAREAHSLIGFSLAKRMSANEGLAIAFLATRVLSPFRNQGIAKTLLKKITQYFILSNKIFKPLNWFKPVYFVTATANPIVFENLKKYRRVFPSLKSKQPDNIQLALAERFAELFLTKERFNKESFVLRCAFLNSAEFYKEEQDIPWSDNADTNAFLEDRLNLKERAGNGLIVVGRIL